MTETTNEPTRKANSSIKTYIIYAVVVIILSYGFTYIKNIWNFNSQFKNIESALAVPVSEQEWQSDPAAELTDWGTFWAALPQDQVQIISINPTQGALIAFFQDMAVHFGQPASAAQTAEAIKKAQQENPENETLKKMAVNDFDWHKQAALAQKIGYLEFLQMDPIARQNYLTTINYKASLPVNARGLIIFSTEQLNGIVHCGNLPVDSNDSTTKVIAQLWDKKRDIIQEVTLTCQSENLDKAMAAFKPVLASISYEGKDTAGLVQQVQTCFDKVKTMDKFRQIKITQQPQEQTQDQPETQPADQTEQQ